MGFGEITVFFISIVIMLIGMAGIILPIIPSTPIIWIGAFFYAICTGFEKISWTLLLIFAVMTILSIVLENFGNVYGAKKFGATKWGVIGSLVGMAAGFILSGPIGLILGPIIGTVVFEFFSGKDYRSAMKSGFGNFVGFLGGTVIKIAIGLIMMGWFVWNVFMV